MEQSDQSTFLTHVPVQVPISKPVVLEEQEVKIVPLKLENLKNLSGKQSTLQNLIEGSKEQPPL